MKEFLKKCGPFCLLLIPVILIGICSCTFKKRYTADEIAKLYEQKYNDTFTVAAADTQVWTSGYTEIILKSGTLDEKITVWLYEDGHTVDNYMPMKLRADAEARVQALAEQVYGDCIVVNNPIGFGIDLFEPSMTLEAYMKSSESQMMFCIAVTSDPGDRDAHLAALAELFAEQKICTNVCIYYYDSLGNIQIDKHSNSPLQPMPQSSMYAIIDANYQISYSNWSD